MEIQVHNENGRVPVTVMHVHGNIDSSTYQAFEAKAEIFMYLVFPARPFGMTD